MRRAFIFDMTNYVVSYWAATAGQGGMLASDAAVSLVRAVQKKFSPDRILCAYDRETPTFRHDVWEAYKSDRKKKHPSCIRELDDSKEKLRAIGVRCLSREGYEADDILASATKAGVDAGWQVVVVTRDKDARQLLKQGSVSILLRASRKGGKWIWEWMTEEVLLEKTGLTPAKWTEFQLIAGDQGDCWPGAVGVGDKTATKLLERYDNAQEIQDAVMVNNCPVKLNSKQRQGILDLDLDVGYTVVTLFDGLDLSPKGKAQK